MKIKAIFISDGLSPGPHRKGPPYLYSESHFLEFIKYDSMEDDFFKLNLNIVENLDNISVIPEASHASFKTNLLSTLVILPPQNQH